MSSPLRGIPHSRVEATAHNQNSHLGGSHQYRVASFDPAEAQALYWTAIPPMTCLVIPESSTDDTNPPSLCSDQWFVICLGMGGRGARPSEGLKMEYQTTKETEP